LREDLIILSTKDWKYQIVGRRTKKLTERFVRSYKIKEITSANVVELELLSIVKLDLVVNISKVYIYIGQVAGQRKR